MQLTYQEETRVLDRDTPVRMETLYDMLFPARKYEEDTLDGEKATEEPNKEGSELAHAKKAAKGRGKGRRKAAGRGHTPGVEEGPEETQKEKAEVAQAKNDRILQRIWNSCEQYENCRGRLVDAIDCRNAAQLRVADRLSIWKHAVWAWADGWLLGTMSRQDEMPLDTATAACVKLASKKPTSTKLFLWAV